MVEKKPNRKFPLKEIRNPTPEEIIQRSSFQVLSMISQGYLLSRSIRKIIPDESRNEDISEELAKFNRRAQKIDWKEDNLENQTKIMIDCMTKFLKSIPKPGKESKSMPWKILHSNLLFDSSPSSFYYIPPIFLSPTGWQPSPAEINELIEALRELQRVMDDPADAAFVEQMILEIEAALQAGQLERFWQLMTRLFEWLKNGWKFGVPSLWYARIVWMERIVPIFARWTLLSGGTEAGGVFAMLYANWIAALAALGIGIIVGFLINHIPVSESENISESLGDLIYHWFLETDADRLIAAQNALVGELGRYEDMIRDNVNFSQEQKLEAISVASALISIVNQKLDIGAESQRNAEYLIRRARRLIDKLS